MITQEYVKELFEYKNGKLYWKVRKASKIYVGDVAGWKHHSGYTRIEIDGKDHALHRLVFLYHHGYLPKYVDHIDQNRNNNRIENLREVTATENRVNSSKTWTKHGYKGVKQTRAGKFESRSFKDGKYYHFGTYETPEEAHQAYLKGREELYPGIAKG